MSIDINIWPVESQTQSLTEKRTLLSKQARSDQFWTAALILGLKRFGRFVATWAGRVRACSVLVMKLQNTCMTSVCSIKVNLLWTEMENLLVVTGKRSVEGWSHTPEHTQSSQIVFYGHYSVCSFMGPGVTLYVSQDTSNQTLSSKGQLSSCYQQLCHYLEAPRFVRVD